MSTTPTSTLAAALAAALLLILAAPTASAQSKADTQRAVKLAEDARNAFAEDRFAEAAELLKQAFEIYPEPNFVWNMARAYEMAGLDDEALASYLRFSTLEVEEPDREAALERAARFTALTTLPPIIQEAQASAELSSLRRDNSALRRSVAERPEPKPLPAEGMSLFELGGWSSAGLGVVALGAAFTLHLASIGTVEEYNKTAAQGLDSGKYEALRDTLNTRVVTSRVLLGTGLALAASGGVLLYLEYFAQEPPATGGLLLAPALGPDTAGALIQGSF